MRLGDSTHSLTASSARVLLVLTAAAIALALSGSALGEAFPLTTATADQNPWNDVWLTASVGVSLEATDGAGGAGPGIDRIEYWITPEGGSPSFESTTTNPASITVSTEGTTTFQFRAVDSALQEEATQTTTVKIDLTDPEVTATPIGDNTPNVSFDLSVADAISGPAVFEYRIDEGTTQTVSGVATTTPAVTKYGDHTLHYYAKDVAGREKSGSVGFFVTDVTAPVTTASPPKAGWDDVWLTATHGVSLLAVDGPDGSGVNRIEYWITPEGGSPAFESTTTNPASIAFSTEGTTTLQFRAVDSALQEEATQTTTVKIDRSGPDVLVDKGPDAPSVTVTITATDPYSGLKELRYRADSDPATITAPGGQAVRTVTGPLGVHSVTYEAEDSIGHVTQGVVFFTITDETKPSVVATILGNNTTSARASLVASDGVGGSGVDRIEYRVDRGSTTFITTQTVVGETTTTPAITSAGSYTLFYSVRDVAGNETTGTVAFTVGSSGGGGGGGGGGGSGGGGGEPPDTTPPTVSAAVSLSGWTNAAAVKVTVTASDDSGNVTVTYTGAAQPQTGASPQTAVVNVTAEGVTTVRFSASDATGLKAEGSAVVQIDRTSPPAPVKPSYVFLTADSVGLAWLGVEDALSGMLRYDVYDGSTKVGSTTGTSFSAGGLAASSAHSYAVVAVDKAGNQSPKSDVLAVTVPVGEGSVNVAPGANVAASVNVPVAAGGTLPVKAAFSSVTKAGKLRITRALTPPHPADPDFEFVNQYFDISFDGTFVGAVTVTLPYDAAMSDARARNLKLKHWKNNGWEDVPITVDLVRHTITASVASLSPVALAERPGVNTTTRVVTPSKLAPGYGRAAVVVARLVDASGTALPHKAIKVEVSRNRIAWSASATMTPVRGKAGSYSIGLATIGGGRTYVRVRFAADDFNQASSAVVTVLPQVDLTAVNVAASLTRTTTLSGSIRPAHRAAVTVELRRQISRTKWSTKRVSLKTNAAGKWSARMTFTPGTWKLRVVAPTDASHSASASQYRVLYVR